MPSGPICAGNFDIVEPKEQNVWLSLDMAKGLEEYAWYIQPGYPQ